MGSHLGNTTITFIPHAVVRRRQGKRRAKQAAEASSASAGNRRYRFYVQNQITAITPPSFLSPQGYAYVLPAAAQRHARRAPDKKLVRMSLFVPPARLPDAVSRAAAARARHVTVAITTAFFTRTAQTQIARQRQESRRQHDMSRFMAVYVVCAPRNREYSRNVYAPNHRVLCSEGKVALCCRNQGAHHEPRP